MDRVVEPGEFKIMVGGHSPSYIAADQIKNSVGFRTPEDGLSFMLNYQQPFKANFELSFENVDNLSSDGNKGNKKIIVRVRNTGNLTDVEKLRMYVDGVLSDDVHHFELAPNTEKLIQFEVVNKPGEEITVTSKYKSVSMTL
jgi:beta-glucosidase